MTSSSGTEFSVSCPHCHQRLSVESGEVSRSVRCPNCEKLFLVVSHSPELSPGPIQPWITGLALGLLGSLSPVIILVAMAVTLVFGPFALVLAPAVGLAIAVVSSGYVFLRAGRRWFWFYVGVGLACSLLLQLWPARAPPGADGPSVEALAQASAVARLLHRAVIVLWLLGAGYVWWRKSR